MHHHSKLYASTGGDHHHVTQAAVATWPPVAGMKRSTPSASALKRKSEDAETFKKKSRMEDSVEDVQLLQMITDRLDVVFKSFPQFQQELWYKRLETRWRLIAGVKPGVDISTRPELELPFGREGLPFTDSDNNSEEYKLVTSELDYLDTLRNAIIKHSHVSNLPRPSTYCLAPNYKKAQSNTQFAVRDGRTGTIPVALELLHNSFRTFTYWAFLDPYPLPGSPARSEEKRKIDNNAFIKVYQAANRLLLTMPVFYTSHNDRVSKFKEALQSIFPDDADYGWFQEVPADQGLPNIPAKIKVDIVYRHKATRIPFIFAEVKLEFGEGGNPFWQNHRLYQTYATENFESRNNGAPIFLVQLCGTTFLFNDLHISQILPSGTHLGIGGAFYDVPDKPPVALQLGGYVNLQNDYVGRNLRETVNSLWALHEAIKLIPRYVFLFLMQVE